jgi:acyl-CoA thioester hydrolase
VNDQPPSNPSTKPNRQAPQLADFPHRVNDLCRFGDLDPQGHVNQSVYLTYFESGRVGMFRNKDLGIGVPGITFVVARMEINYLRELHWPWTIEIGTGVVEFGRTSFKVAQGIFREGVCHATGLATMVCMGIATRKATPLPPEAIEKLSRWKLKGA